MDTVMDDVIEKILDMSPEEGKRLQEDILINAYVPDADLMTREDALALAEQRDNDAAMMLEEDCLEGTLF